MKKACVIGWPISHSRSPIIHNYWLKHYGLQGEYTRVPVPPEQLGDFIASLERQGLEGCNVTIPHKEAVFRLVTPADDMTRQLGVANTIFRRDGMTLGTSTDGEGFLLSLMAEAPCDLGAGPAVMIGAGGAATAIAAALVSAGCPEIRVANRTLEKSQLLRDRFGDAIRPVEYDSLQYALKDAVLLVNTTSLGMAGCPDLDVNLDRLPESAVVYDIIYVPLETRLLSLARQRGHRAVNGLSMLLYQAVRGFELWFGVRPQVTQELYERVAADVRGGLAT